MSVEVREKDHHSINLPGASAKNAKISNNYFDGLDVTSIHKLLFFIIMLAYFFEQMDNWNFGFIAPALMKSWGINMAAIGKINFAYFVAMTLGGLTGGVISDFIGRRKTFLGAILLFSFGSIANGFAQNVEIFTITRAITGFGVFCMMVTSQVYIAEMAPAATRGKWQSLTASIGFMAAPLVGLLCRVVIPLSPEAWRYIFFLGGVGLIGFIMGIKYLKESPRWLVTKGKKESAEKVIEQLTNVKVDLTEAASIVEPRVKTVDVLAGILSPKYLKRTLVILFFVLLTVPAGFVITNWTPTLLNQRGLSVNDALTASSLLMFGVPAGCYLSSLIADKGGRKIPMAVMAISVAVLAVIFGQIKGFAPIVICGFLLIAVNMAMNFITFSYIAENYPTKMRNTSTGIHNSAGRLATSVLQLYIPIVFAQYKFTGVYNMVAILVCIPVIVLLLWGLKTGGKSLEEIS
ncbi:MFS transporter [Desulfosporosinus sp. PR]|uniref:MFS transporter n=1 Tax=Candidatus Desulfosporosinus nitrosoreducens TaxID=3401928 RepID=UPI0027E67E9D|nr:MFS transporter [Desulfosporosinus sp. PR]MDQ7094576.1 MFS transporter [Desulfosporosinus sp. PR]